MVGVLGQTVGTCRQEGVQIIYIKSILQHENTWGIKTGRVSGRDLKQKNSGESMVGRGP